MRKAGILMPVSSLPSKYGCGTFGMEAKQFIDLAYEAGLKIWQILPLNPLGNENSPYTSFSSYAIDDIYISLDLLYQKGLIKKAPSFHRRKKRVDYKAIRKFREPYLREAFSNFRPDQNYTVFAYQEWAKNYAMFKAFMKTYGEHWCEWPEEVRNQPEEGKVDLKPFEEEILYQLFIQYEAFLEWKEIKQYANDRDIEIMGDIPFYVGLDSSDVWAGKKQFMLEKDGTPSFIAGVPPDYFSATGQRWGNPIYNWDHMKEDGFVYWLDRLSYTQRLFDIVRVDHFRAFDTYWKIKASCPTAIDGEWVEAPGYDLFDIVLKNNPDMVIVAEDLGFLRKEVLELRDHYKFRGMRVIQFSFDVKGMPEDPENLTVYTGTHDNMTIDTWYRGEFSRHDQRAMRNCLKKLGYRDNSFVKNVIRYSLDSNADMVIIPLSDWMHEGKDARINLPGTVSDDNWTWRITSFSKLRKNISEMKEMIAEAGR